MGMACVDIVDRARQAGRGGDAAARFFRVPDRQRPVGAHGDGICAGRPPVRLRTGRQRCVSSRTARCCRRRSRRVDGQCPGERGLLGVAFDPQFQRTGSSTCYYTATTPAIHNRVSRFTAAGDMAVAGARAASSNWSRSAHQPQRRGDSLRQRRQAVCRRGRERRAGQRPDPVESPRQDPAHQHRRLDSRTTIRSTPRPPATTGRSGRSGCAIHSRSRSNRCPAAVHQRCRRATWEEINQGVARRELWLADDRGRYRPTRASAHRCIAYSHGNGCAISGGAFHNLTKPQFPIQYRGAYFFADLCGGWIALRAANGTVSRICDRHFSAGGPDDAADGSLYYLARGRRRRVRRCLSDCLHSGSPEDRSHRQRRRRSLAAHRRTALQIALSFDAGNAGIVNPAELYIGVASPFGVFWLDRQPARWSPSVARAFTRSTYRFWVRATLVTVPDVSVLPAGALLVVHDCGQRLRRRAGR